MLGHDWQPLQPMSAEVNGNVVTVHFHVPVPPLAWDAGLPPPHGTMIRGLGGRAAASRSARAGVRRRSPASRSSATTRSRSRAASDLSGLQVVVGYAATAEGGTPPAAQPARWGHLRDSDPFVGTVTASAQPNYCVAFQMNTQ